MADQPLESGDRALQLVVDSIRDYAIFRLDPGGHIASWNLGAQLIKGYSAEEIVGSSLSRFYTEDDRAAGRPERLLERARTEGHVEDEGWRVRKDGTRFWADVIITAIRSETGELVGYAKVTRDLSERRRAEEVRLGESARFRAIVDSTRDYAIFALDTGGHVATWNPGAQRIKGYDADEIIGQHFSRFYPAERIAEGVCEMELATALRDGRFEDEGWRLRKDGTELWANVVITPLYDMDQRHIGFSKITRDLTERRKWELDRLALAQANEAVRLRDEFLSIASHEIRTPLMALQLQLDVALEHRATLDPKVASKLERASRNAQRLSDLTDALLDVGRISVGKMSIALVATDLGDLVRDVIDRLADTAAAAKCNVTARIAPGIVGAWDAMRIQQVVTNLLANAYKYAAKSDVDVDVHATDGVARVCVRDRGPGIPVEERERIFARFERAAPRNLGGLGLGLYVAQQIVLAHGGTIRIDDAEGGGVAFEVSLPITEPAL